ncbi:uncharacterized protein NEMAJ01_0565 [Nematocida major]|uniref:uncharacterized protein n=1 Tax=Nematocida major TaxID=1912982 RepID=UPI002008177E|nr:uncharacterized protein NEMAJ01_0565 [Nematocida major]KAH9385669.1 hypothetical protein NEMAJ01_0565 [Nematocida major]
MSSSKKVFVFDLNGTLLARVKENKGKLMKMQEPDGVLSGPGDLIYLRPHLGELVEFLHKNNVQYALWTTAMEHNGVRLASMVEKAGMTKALGKYYHAHSEPIKGHPYKRSKNMQVVASATGVSIEDVFLIDDEVLKCIPVSCHIPIEEYKPLEEDTELLRIIEVIKGHL